MRQHLTKKRQAEKTFLLLLVTGFLGALLMVTACRAGTAERGSIRRGEAAQKITVAVTSNFLQPAKELATHYERETGVQVAIVSSSTGKLYAQICNGAPFDVFLAADALRPALLHQEGKCLPPFVYAVGRVVLWTGRAELFDAVDWKDFFPSKAPPHSEPPRPARQKILRAGVPQKIALPQPQLAPYGEAARQALITTALWQQVAAQMVFGQNVAQAFQFAASGAADLAFTAASLALSHEGKKGRFWPVEEAEPVVQQGCMVSEDNEEAASFVASLLSGKNASLLRRYGYEGNQP